MAKTLGKRKTGSFLLTSTALLTIAIAAGAMVAPIDSLRSPVTSAQAQGVAIDIQFRSALEPHGRWQRHQRWGEIWIPARRDRDWRPYTEGRWVYTDEWGWFWVSDEEFGWVTYHYGRWVLDAQLGWIWIPGNEWGPAWVQWRRGDRHAGWAPLPPQQVIYDYDDDPYYWVFVSFNNFTAPNIRRVVVPQRERVIYIRETVVVNRTIIVDRGPRIAVNPGIEPRIVAARIGRPIRVANVKPVVVAGTTGVQNAVEIRADQRDRRRERVRIEVSEKKETIQPAKEVPPPQALKKGEEGRLGDRPPEAAKGQATTQPDTTKGKQDDLAKGKAKEEAKGKDAAKTEPSTRDAKSKTEDVKGEPKTSKGDDLKGTPKTTKTDDKGEPKTTKSDDKGKQPATVGKSVEPDKGKQPATVGKSVEPDKGKQPATAGKSVEPDKGKEKQSVMPKAESKQLPSAAPKAPEPKQLPAAVPKAAEPKQPAAAPKAPEPKGAKGKDEEKGKGG
jgi:hypothetical protein